MSANDIVRVLALLNESTDESTDDEQLLAIQGVLKLQQNRIGETGADPSMDADAVVVILRNSGIDDVGVEQLMDMVEAGELEGIVHDMNSDSITFDVDDDGDTTFGVDDTALSPDDDFIAVDRARDIVKNMAKRQLPK